MLKKMMLFILILSFIFLVGCTLSIPIQKPVLTAMQYSQPHNEQVVINIVDQRVDKQFHKGAAKLEKFINKGKMVFENMENPVEFLADNLQKEFEIRGIPVIFNINNADNNEADMTLNIDVYQIVSRRVSGFSPWEAFHSFKGTLSDGKNKHQIYAYFYDMRVPIMSINEIIEPCFNRPISILTKEIVSKINNKVFKYKTTDENVNSLVNSIEGNLNREDTGLYLKFLELGSSNNENAIEHLKKYANYSDQFLRACALTSIGFMVSENEFDFLVEKYNESTAIAKYMALKSIGDIGSQRSLEFIQKAKENPLYESEGGFKYCVDLYLF